MKKKSLYVWDWVGGGANSAMATSRADAIKEAKKIWSAGCVIVTTLHIGTKAEVEGMRAIYSDD